ncbi:hypothetical protein [Bacillus cereus group sp. N21]|uniref:hypothetical protein n=1 Tax=Bacillus cereus group sp. N21 TaxID=2794591 RepID=UPI0018F511AD|nr:hypothetical protein [Bacillus cereus group sp. N21]MBJ8031068.1 hypothetical protein [Bacillus cereus group sp. N21]
MKERLQVYYDPEVDVQVNQLIKTFEQTGKGKRGYTTDKIKECLKVYQVLAERCGTSEPMDVLLHYIDSSESKGLHREENRGLLKTSNIAVEKDAVEMKKVSDEVDNSVADLLGDGGEFEFGDNI